MSLVKKLAGETAIYGLSSIVGRVVNWVILTPYLTRVFLESEYGIVNDLYFYIALLLVFFTYRMETAFFRFASRAKAEQSDPDTIFTTASLSIIATTVFFTTLLLWLAPNIANWLKYPGREDYVRVFTFIVAFDALAAIPFARLRMDSRPIRFALIKLSAIVINIILVFFFLEAMPWAVERNMGWAKAIYNPEHRVAYIFWANLLASGCTLVLLSPLYYQLAWRFAQDVWQRMLNYALPLVLAAVAGIVNQLIGTPLLKILGPGTTEENLALGGIYAAAAKLAVLMNLFVQAFNYAAEPFFFRQAAESDDKAIYADVTRAFALIGSLGFLGIMLYLEVIQYFLGQDFRQGLGVLPILLVANFFLGLYYNFSIGYKLSDQTRWASYIAALGAIITLAINFTFIPSIDIYAPAWASLACFLSMCIAAYFVTRKFWPVNYQLGRMAYYLLTAIVAWLVSIGLAQTLPDQVGIRIGVNTVLLCLTLLIWYRTEKEWVRQILGLSK
ncbi:MAG: polysaccharide biosynthesis C-terminal domain-containing protein [Bacteroidota bacterium]